MMLASLPRDEGLGAGLRWWRRSRLHSGQWNRAAQADAKLVTDKPAATGFGRRKEALWLKPDLIA